MVVDGQQSGGDGSNRVKPDVAHGDLAAESLDDVQTNRKQDEETGPVGKIHIVFTDAKLQQKREWKQQKIG